MENKTQAVINEIKKVIIGKDAVIEKVFMSVLAGGHVLLEDVPGVGKTTLALSFSKALGLDYKRMQFTSDSLPSDIVGFTVYNKQTGDFQYKEGVAMTNLLLADEINRTSSKTQSALLEVMEEGQMTVDSITHKVPQPFVVIATQNPAGSAGTQMLPNSQMDRFMVRLAMGYPDIESQINILKDRHMSNPLDEVNMVTDKHGLVQMQADAGAVYIADEVYRYIAQLADGTRTNQAVQLGMSPRGTYALCRMAQAHAYVQGRAYVTPEDVRSVFEDVSSHRLILSPKARISETGVNDVIHDIMLKVPMPHMNTPKVL